MTTESCVHVWVVANLDRKLETRLMIFWSFFFRANVCAERGRVKTHVRNAHRGFSAALFFLELPFALLGLEEKVFRCASVKNGKIGKQLNSKRGGGEKC